MTGIAVRSALGRLVELDSCSQSGPPGSWRTRIGNARLDKFGAGNRQATGPPLGRTQHCPAHDATFDGEPAVNASGKGGGRPSILALDLAPAAALGPIRSRKQVVTPIGLLVILPIASLAGLDKSQTARRNMGPRRRANRCASGVPSRKYGAFTRHFAAYAGRSAGANPLVNRPSPARARAER